MAKRMTTEQALRGGRFVLRKKKQQKGIPEDQRKSMPKLVNEGHALAKGDKLTKKGNKYKANPGKDDKADMYKYA